MICIKFFLKKKTTNKNNYWAIIIFDLQAVIIDEYDIYAAF